MDHVQGCSQIISATEEGGGMVWQMLTLADEGGKGGLANADITDKNV